MLVPVPSYACSQMSEALRGDSNGHEQRTMLQSVPSFLMNMLARDAEKMPCVTVKGRLTEDKNQKVECSLQLQVVPSIRNIRNVSLAATRKSAWYCTQLQTPTLQHGKMQRATCVLPVAVGVSAETVVARLLRSSLWMQAP
eukprot:s4202_g7.t1